MRRRSPSIAVALFVLLAMALKPPVVAEPPDDTTAAGLRPPSITELVKNQQDLTIDGLRQATGKEPAYLGKLDFDPTKARYFELAREELQLTDAEVEIFRKRGFVAMDHGRRHTFSTAYYDIYNSDLPVLVTSDSILHALHKSYDAILSELETTWFSWTLDEVLAELHLALELEATENRNAALAENYHDVDLYITMARNLLAGAGGAQADQQRARFGGAPKAGASLVLVGSKLQQDKGAESLLDSIKSLQMPNPNIDPPTEIYGGKRYIDFSQFRPRGHYADSPQLKSYFRCMMWLGRADTGWNVLPTEMTPGVDSDDERELRNAALFTHLVRRTGNAYRVEEIQKVIAYLVGQSDSLDSQRLETLMRKQGVDDIGQLVDRAQLAKLQDAIVRSEASRQWIRSQIVISNPYDEYKVPPPSTFQAFGQRFAIDSYVMSQVVFDSIIFQGRKERRMMPQGLDVMAALGNDRAVSLLENDLQKWKYSANLLASRQFVERQRPEFWDANLYNLWLDGLRELDANVVGQAHAPQVMKTAAWQAKQLQTQLASWSQLRHDTVLYAKQSYTAFPSCEYPAGYVEPYPEFFAKVRTFATRAKELIAANPYASPDAGRQTLLQKAHQRHLEFFSTMAAHVGRLETMARKELAAEPFDEADRDFIARTINNRGVARFGSGSRPQYNGWYAELLYSPDPNATDSSWEATIADVHSDPESGQVLQTGVGNLNLCLIAIDNQEDRTVYVGPVFSYYEFQHPASKRLTDNEWQTMLRLAKQPARPEWVAPFVATPKSRPNHGSAVVFHRIGDVARFEVNTQTKKGTSYHGGTLPLTDEGLKTLGKLHMLRTLDLARSQVTNEGIKHLNVLEELRNLNLGSTRIDGSQLASLSKAKWLRVLVLRNTQVGDNALPQLRSFKHLEVLDLSGTRVTSKAVTHLVEMDNLRELNVQRTSINEDEIKRLRAALPKCKVD